MLSLVAEVIGVAAVVTGIALVSVPAALIVGGIAAVAAVEVRS